MTPTTPSTPRTWCAARRWPRASPRCTTKPVLHGDNGATLKATTVLAMLHLAGRQAVVLAASRERRQRLRRVAVPHRQVPAGVPRQGLRRPGRRPAWAAASCIGTTIEHRHSGIRYVTPAQRHAGEDHAILAARHALYLQARERNPARWSGTTRNWTPIGAVTLNPERDSVVTAHSASRRYAAVGCMNEATTTLTRAASGRA